jgi:hypothetical protein
LILCHIIIYPPHFTESFYLNHMLVKVWKYDALTVAACLLSVLLALPPANVLIAGWKNVVAVWFCPMTIKKASRCNSCGKFFDSKRELREHIDKNHRITASKISEAGINK